MYIYFAHVKHATTGTGRVPQYCIQRLKNLQFPVGYENGIIWNQSEFEPIAKSNYVSIQCVHTSVGWNNPRALYPNICLLWLLCNGVALIFLWPLHATEEQLINLWCIETECSLQWTQQPATGLQPQLQTVYYLIIHAIKIRLNIVLRSTAKFPKLVSSA